METKSNEALWIFLLGYFSAILVMWIADALSDYLSSALESSGVIISENGNSGEKGETVTSLVKEYTEDV